MLHQSFIALRWDKTSFPAEATLSRFENRGRVFHTLILRNVDEQLASEQRIHSLDGAGRGGFADQRPGDRSPRRESRSHAGRNGE